jgi:hypothetical protein
MSVAVAAMPMAMGQPMAMQQMQITVPPGVGPGQAFIVALPSGAQMQVTCPPGVEPGGAIMIEVPMEAQPPIAMGFAITPEMQQQALSVGAQDQVPLLDPETAGILATVNSFRVNQRVKFWETMSRGCCEQSNTYDVFDETTGTHLFIAQEVSDDCMRCGCAPTHSLRVEFKRVNQTTRQWASSNEIKQMPTVMSLERQGCFDKPCLQCCIINDSCKDGMNMNAGAPITAQPGDVAIHDQTFAYATQPKCGGYCTPSLNLFNRMATGPKETAFVPLAKVEGPMIFGGCSELCFDSTFDVSSLKPEELDTKLKKGDLARITKVRPKGPCACGKEMFTDSDTFTVTYAEGVGLTPQQKAAMMGSMILTDYMFFEQDQGMCTVEGSKVKITLFECYCCGALCPATLVVDNSNGGGGGAPPRSQEMVR